MTRFISSEPGRADRAPGHEQTSLSILDLLLLQHQSCTAGLSDLRKVCFYILQADVKAYEIALRMGVRFIEIDIFDGTMKDGKLVPLTCNKTSTLEEALETIKRHAFAKSEYPLMISLDVRCNHDNQIAAASLMKDIFGESLLTELMNSREENELPSPEELKGKIVLKHSEDQTDLTDSEEKDEEKVGEAEVEFFIGEVWFCIPNKDREWKKKEMIWGNETLSFVTPKEKILIELCAKPYFVGYMKKDAIEKCMNEVQEKIPGNFLVSCNQAYTEFQLSVCNKRGKIIHFRLAFDGNKHFLDSDVDRSQKFDTIDNLVEYYGANYITLSLAKLSEPLNLNETSAHKYMEWFCGDLDPKSSSELMATVGEKGAFLVREEETFYSTNYVIEYFDGQRLRQVQVLQDHAGGNLTLPKYKSCNAQTIIEVVNHFRVNFLKNATKLGNAVQLMGEVLEDHNQGGEALVTRFQKLSIKRKSREMFIDKNEKALDPTKIEVSARITNQIISEELRYDISSAEIKKDKLKSLFLKYPHDTRLVMLANEVGGEKTEIHITMEEDIDLVFDALSREVTQLKEQRRRATTKGQGRVVSGRSTSKTRKLSRKPTIVLCKDLADLVIYGRSTKMTLDKNHAEKCNTRTRLRKAGQIGLLKKLDWSDCLDYKQMTSVDNLTLNRNISPFNIKSFIEFHQSFLTKVHPGVTAAWKQNYDPIPIWQSGVQAATVNLHLEEKQVYGSCNPIQVNNAMFLDTNGGSGYVLKPERLMTSPETSLETSCIITLKILEGRHLKTLKPPRELLYCPHIEVSTFMQKNSNQIIA